MSAFVRLVAVTLCVALPPLFASAAEPASRPGGVRVALPEGERGKILRVEGDQLVVQPLTSLRGVRGRGVGAGEARPAPQPGAATAPSEADEAAAEAPVEKSYTINAQTRISAGIVTGERMTATGDLVRTIEFDDGTVADLKPGFEVFVTAGEDNIATRIGTMPKPIIEPGAVRGGVTTRRAGARPPRGLDGPLGMFMGGGIRGKVIKADGKSVTIRPTEGGAGAEGAVPAKPADPDAKAGPVEKTFQLAERTRIMLPSDRDDAPGGDGRAVRRISYVAADAASLKPGLDVAITAEPRDESVARRIMIIPEGFGDFGSPPPGRRAATRPTTRSAVE